MTAMYHGAQFQADLAAAIGQTPLIRLRRAAGTAPWGAGEASRGGAYFFGCSNFLGR